MKIKHFIILLSLISIFQNIKTEQNSFQIKTVFLTGAAGFIGSNFLEYMFDKYPSYHFLVLDSLTYAGNIENIPEKIRSSKRFEFFYGSITNPYIVNHCMKRADFVVHFAAESHVTNSIFEDSSFFDTDVMGTRVMMRSLVKFQNSIERYIHISTSEVLGTALTQPMDEKHPLMPKTPYAAAKTGADRLVYSYCCTYPNIPAVIIRPFNNYGPRQHLEKLIPKFISNIIRGEKIQIHGDGLQSRDWLHTTDTAIALDKVLHNDNFEDIKHEVIHIGSGISISILDIAKKILKAFNLTDDMMEFIDDRPGQVDCHISSTLKAKKVLNWESQIQFDEGLAKTIEWYKNNYNWWKNTRIVADYLVDTSKVSS